MSVVEFPRKPLAHAVLSCSGSSRWIGCPGSRRMEEPFPEETSPYAEEGTRAHHLLEVWLREGKEHAAALRIKEPELYDESMWSHIQRVVAYVFDLLRANEGASLMVEQRLDLHVYIPQGFGTADVLILTRDGRAILIDLKYGQGVKVSADCTQLRLYGLGTVETFNALYDIDMLELHIAQPRLDHYDSFEIRRTDLERWGVTVVRPAAELAMTDDAPLNPSEEACRFCRARHTCRARAEQALALAKEEFDSDTLTPEEIAEMFGRLKEVERWVKDVKDYVYQTIERKGSGAIPGYKLVEGRSMREWRSEEEAVKRLRNARVKAADLWTRKLISPAQAEKLLGKDHKVLRDCVATKTARPSVVPDSDPRPAAKTDIEKQFEEIPDEQ